MTQRRAVALALGLTTLALAAGALGAVLMGLDWHVRTSTAAEAPFRGAYGLVGATFVISGAFLALRRPRNPLGWLYLLGGALVLMMFAASEYALAVVAGHRALPGRSAALVAVAADLGLPALSCLFLSATVFPPGRLLSRRWRWAWWWTGAATLLLTVGSALIAGVPGSYPGAWTALARNPLGTEALWVGAVLGVGFVAWLGAFGLAGLAVGLRWRRGSQLERLQLRWPALALGLALASFFASWPATGLAADLLNVLFVLFLVAIPVTVAAAVLRYRLYDLERLVSRTVAYALVTASLAGLYFGVVAFTTRVLDVGSALGVAASTLAAAALFTPLRRRLQRQVDRRFNRARYDADAAVARFTARLRDTVDAGEVERQLGGEIARTLEPLHCTVWMRPPA